MKVLVTGGAGFIGGHIVDRLYADGHEVNVLDNESSNSNDNYHWLKTGTRRFGDNVQHWESVNACIKLHDIDIIFHLAAESRIQPTIQNPRQAFLTNTIGTCNILQSARENNVKRVIFSSTSAVYGMKNSPPLREDMPVDCLNPYSTSKYAAEEMCRMYTKLFGVETVILRYFNVYGERQPIKGQYAPVTGIFGRQKKSGQQMTIVGDGEQKRDFTYVQDVVQANILSSNLENKNVVGETFNVGSGESTSVLELAKLIGGEYTFIPERQGEARTTLADISKIKGALGWAPSIKIQDWIKNNGNY